MSELSAGLGITPLESGGFGSWLRITTLASGISEALGAPLTIAAIYDRDYFCQEEVANVKTSLSKSLKLAHVHERKEIENYLLVSDALDRAIERAVSERAARTGGMVSTQPKADNLLREITDQMRDDVQSQIIAKRTNYLRASGKDIAEITRETLTWFSPRWEDFSQRLWLLPGKEVLRIFREKIHASLGVTLTDARIVDAIHKDEVPSDLRQLLFALNEFRKAAV